jgi:WD40 repeat protein
MSTEAGLRTQYQYVIKERDELQSQCDQLTRENFNLRKAVYELSSQLSHLTSSNFFRYDSKTQQFGFIHSNITAPLAVSMIPTSVPLPSGGRDVSFPTAPLTQTLRDNRTLNFECELKGHNGPIYCVDITPDNRWIASGSFDKTIVIWKGTVPYKQESILTGHSQLISGLCWGRESLTTPSSEKKMDTNPAPVLYSTSFDKTVCVLHSAFSPLLCLISSLLFLGENLGYN